MQALYTSSFTVSKAFSSIHKWLSTWRALLCWLWCPVNCSEPLGELWEHQIFQFRPSLHHQFTKKELQHSRGLGNSTFSSESFSENRTHLVFQAGKNKHECLWNDCFSVLSQAGSAAPFSLWHVLNIPWQWGDPVINISIRTPSSWVPQSHLPADNYTGFNWWCSEYIPSHSAVAEKCYWYFIKACFQVDGSALNSVILCLSSGRITLWNESWTKVK